MIENRNPRIIRNCVGLTVGLLLALAVLAAGQSPSAHEGSRIISNQSREVTLAGSVERLVQRPAPGAPAGLHLLLSASGSMVDAHLGPFFSKQNQDALEAGKSVQVVGSMTSVNGLEVMLVRQLTVDGRVITVRNERGFLAREVPVRRNVRDAKSTPKGGAQ